MANVIKPKRSAVAGNIPTTAQIGQYEIAMNTADKKMFTSDGTNIIQIAAGGLNGLSDVLLTAPLNGQGLAYNSTLGKWVNSSAGSGDVVGPSSATDNAIARFDSTTGKLIQNSTVTLDDAGVMQGVTLDSYLNVIGSNHIHYRIKAGEALVKGDVIKYVSWNAGENAMLVSKLSSASDIAIGMVDSTLAIGEFGLATISGVVEGIDTSAYSVNTILYPNGSGGLTTTKPTSGMYQACAFVIRSQAINGAVLVSFISPDYVQASTNTANTVVLRDGSGNFSAGTITATLAGNASTVTNGVYTTGSYADPSWLTSVNYSKLTGTIPTWNQNTTGSAASLTTARTINGTSFNGTANITTASWGTARTITIGSSGKSVDGSGNISWTLTEIGAQAADADLTAIAALAGTSGFLKKTAADTWTLDTSTYLTGTKVDSISATSPIVASASTGAITLSHAASGVSAGTYNNVTVNTTGHVTAASNVSYLTSETDTLQSVTNRGNTTTNTITHGGLVPSSGTNIDQIYSASDSLTLTTSWQDTSVNAAELATGTYIVQVYANDNAVGGGHYQTYYSGVMSWFSGDTNETSSDEIVLHRAGHASNSGKIYLRILRTSTADAADLKLQIAGTTNNTAASTYSYKFRRLI